MRGLGAVAEYREMNLGESLKERPWKDEERGEAEMEEVGVEGNGARREKVGWEGFKVRMVWAAMAANAACIRLPHSGWRVFELRLPLVPYALLVAVTARTEDLKIVLRSLSA